MVQARLAAAAVALAVISGSARAQRTGAIAGSLTDSIHKAALSDATLFIAREQPAQPEFSRTVTADQRGRYRADSLPPGRYNITLNHAMLDSLDLYFPPRVVDVAEGATVNVDFALPSGETLRRAACPGVALPPGTGGVVGHVMDADADRPLAGATVVVSWTELTVDRTTLRASAIERTGSTKADSTGIYRLCGVTTGSTLAVQVQVAGRAGSPVSTEVPDDIGFARLDLEFSASASRSLAAIPTLTDTTQRDDTTALSGTAALSGVAVNNAGAPLSGVEIRVAGAAGSTRTDSLGRFTLGALPAGSQTVEGRRIGYLIGRRTVALRSGRKADVQLRLERIVSLDSIRIVAQRARYREFEQRRRSGLGRYMTEEQIANRNAFETRDLLATIPGFVVVGDGIDARVLSTRARGFSGRCSPNIVIDNMQNQEISLIHPRDIGAMEFYNDGVGGPPGMNKGCGVIVIWSKR